MLVESSSNTALPYTGFENAPLEDLYQKMEEMNSRNSQLATYVQLGTFKEEDFDFFNYQVQCLSKEIRQELINRGIIQPQE